MNSWLYISFLITFGATPLICAKLNLMKERWTLNAAATRDTSRRKKVVDKLKRASGIYTGKKWERQGLDHTVILNVVSYSGDDHSSYKQHLQNWFCYMRHWRYKPVVYTVSSKHNSTPAEIAYEDETLRSWCPSCEIISYPNNLFWELVAAKKRPMRRGSVYADYEGDVPSFKHFGALVMLVPILEVIELGYNVLFFDIDVTLLRDPVPYMTRSTADISVSPESRDCHFPSHPSFREKTDWYKLEANTGIMQVKATPAAIKLYRAWLSDIINENIMDDQKVLNFAKFGAVFDSSCNWQSKRPVNNSALNLTRGAGNEAGARFCVYSEFMLQNGKIAFRCSGGKGGGLRSTYVLAMTVMGAPSTEYSAAENAPVPESVDHLVTMPNSSSATRTGRTGPHADSSVVSSKSASRGSGSGINPVDQYVFYSPLAVHANFVMDKIGALYRNGLWLIPYSDPKRGNSKDKGKVDKLLLQNRTHNQHQHQRQLVCKDFHISRTNWGDVKRMNWTQEIIDAKKDRELQRSLTDGACVRFPLRKTVYFVQNKTARPFPDGETFERYGCKWNNITTVSWQFVDLPEGPPVPSVNTNTSSASELNQAKNTKMS